jgi:ferrous iron transport protein B
MIEVLPLSELGDITSGSYEGTIDRNIELINQSERSKTINVAMVGNPNCGKTTAFNFISGAKEKVGNYSGVTIDVHKATFKAKGYTFNFYDLPGTYSLTAYSAEEICVRKFIYEQTPDVVINVLDSTNLERSLFLTTQLIDMDLRTIIALNMYDELEKGHMQFNMDKFAKLVGIPIVPTVSSKGKGIDDLVDKVVDVFEGKDKLARHIHINYGKILEESISKIRAELKEAKWITDKISTRFVALKLLEKDTQIEELLSECPAYTKIKQVTEKEIKRVELLENNDSETIVTNAKYGFISGALKGTFKNPGEGEETQSDKIDKVLTHRFWGVPIFIGMLFFMFWATFTLGAYPMDWIDAGVSQLGDFVKNAIPEGMLNDLLVDGIISGAGSVLVFLPNILILFFFISLLEASGYMARVAFIMDNVMHRFGLHGRSFIPMIMGFGCNVPAIMATRSMRNKNDRLLTMLIVPFMSCSARLPVYILIVSAFFSSHQALVMVGIYLIGIIFAFITAQLLNKTVFKSKADPFVMELPTYRMPTFRNVVYNMWDKSKQYLRKIGTIILLGVVIIWSLEYFPRTSENSAVYEQQITDVENNIQFNETEKDNEIAKIEIEQEADRLANSYLGRVGQVIAPVMKPLGFDWKMSIALLAGLPAKEIVVSTMGVLYQTGDSENSVSLQKKLQEEVYHSGKKKGQQVFTIPVALAFLIFILIYFPCIGVIATIKNESGSWKWAVFTMVYTTALAWVVAFLTYNIGNLLI